jgi:adenylate cyclase
MSSIRPVVEWLADGARAIPLSDEVLTELCARMVDAGIPLWRAAAFVNTLHPDVIGSSFIWQAGSGVKVTAAKYEILETDEYRRSPVVAVYATRQPIRRRLADGARPDDFPVLHDLWAEGATDYVAFPLPFTDGTVHVATWTTRQPGGFTDQQFADLEALIAPLTRVVEIRALRRTATNLLNTYVDRQAGERILAGKIRRGFVEEIRAVIWLSDMRGFTALSERLPPQELVDLLNRYFDCQVPAILQRGGEVLKFIGDGLLAIFPLTEGDDPQEVCQRAFSCALDAHRRIDALNAQSAEPIRFGLALHTGHVMYGNIGGGNRLDFTCVGPAVNLAARLEKLAGQLGQAIVASADFAGNLPGRFTQLGECTVVGFSAPQAVFGLTGPSQ